jgi:hypothetical protein
VIPTRVRILLALCTIAALAIFVGAYVTNSNPESNRDCAPPAAIDEIFPACNTLVFQQSTIGVDMAPGYSVELAINGVSIPRDQVENRAATNATSTRIVPDLFVFNPGPGKEVQRLSPGPNSATVTYYKLSANPSTAVQFRWFFTVN